MTVPMPEANGVTEAEAAQDFIDSARYGDSAEVQMAVAEDFAIVHSVDSQGRTALHMASANGHLEVVRVLIAAGADLNVKNVEGNSALHYAALNAHISVIEELIAKGANAGVVNLHERTPLDEAIGRNNAAVVDAINAAVTARSLDQTSVGS